MDEGKKNPIAESTQGQNRKLSTVDIICITIVSVTIIGALFFFTPIVGILVYLCCELYVYLGIPLIVLVFLITAIIDLAFQQKRSGWLKRSLKACILTHGIFILSIVLMGVIVGGIIGGGFANVKELGFWIKMNCLVDDQSVQSIKQWAYNYTPNMYDNVHTMEDGEIFVDRRNWPACIAALNPNYVFVHPKTAKATDLVYGGGFCHWGLCIGPQKDDQTGLSLLRSDAWIWVQKE